jgi:hypothetical protein
LFILKTYVGESRSYRGRKSGRLSQAQTLTVKNAPSSAQRAGIIRIFATEITNYYKKEMNYG